MPYCFDAKKIMYAHIGYAEAQLSRYLRKAIDSFSISSNSVERYFNEFTVDSGCLEFYLKDSKDIVGGRSLLGMPRDENKNGLKTFSDKWEENNLRRIPKSVVAGIRVMHQAQQLLTTGDFTPSIKDYSPELHDKLMAIKLMDANTIDEEFVVKHYLGLEEEIQNLKALYESLPEETKNKRPDIEKIEDILCDIYGVDK